MALCKETLVDLEEKFNKVKKLIDNSITDPETAPYTSKYAARQHLEAMNEQLDRIKLQNYINTNLCNKLIGMFGAVQLQLGILAMETEELSLSEKHFEECHKIIEEHTTDKYVASVCMNLLNQMGILWSKRTFDQGISHLFKAQLLYKQLKENGTVPIDYMDYFNTEFVFNKEQAIEKLEKAYTLTLFYIAQAYARKNPLLSAVYCHKTLQRQYDSDDYEHIDWALNTATLSQFFMERNGFKQAKHHLCASLFMMDQYKKVLDTCEEEGEEYEAKLETYRHRSADVSRCWIKYCLNLLTSSKDRLLETENIEITACTCTDLAEMDLSEYDVTSEDMKDMVFRNIDLAEYEMKAVHCFLLTMDDAKRIFTVGQEFVKSAVDYHTLNTHASDYVEIVQDHSKLYDSFAFFIDDTSVRCKIFKRSADIIEEVQNAINPQYYMGYSRQNWYRLGSIYSDMLDIKLEKITDTMHPTQHAMVKVNSLINKLVSKFTMYIDSYKNPSGELPGKIPEGEEKIFLLAYFHIAAKQSKYCTPDKALMAEKIQKCIDAYKAILAYCKVNEKAAELVATELKIAETMVTLHQLKIARLLNVAPPAIQYT